MEATWRAEGSTPPPFGQGGLMENLNSYSHAAATKCPFLHPNLECQGKFSGELGLPIPLVSNMAASPSPTKECQIRPAIAEDLNKIQSLIQYLKCSEYNQNHLSYQEPGKSQFEWEKTINRHKHWKKSCVGIIWQEFWSNCHKNALAINAWNKNIKTLVKK